MKTIKEQFDECFNENPELTYVSWWYGTSLYQWATMGVQLRLYIALIRHGKGLPEISLYTEEKQKKRVIDGQRLVNKFTESCEHPPSYADIPHYEDLKHSLHKALDARNFLIHRFLPDILGSIQEHASKDSAEAWTKRVHSKGIETIQSCVDDISRPFGLLNKVSSQIEKQLGIPISSPTVSSANLRKR